MTSLSSGDSHRNTREMVLLAPRDTGLMQPMTAWCGALAGSSGRRPRAWDRDDLLRRLHSFRPTTWFLKPPGADPVTCARHGWVNVGADLLACEARLQFYYNDND